MRIHSSSLTFTPVGYNKHQVNLTSDDASRKDKAAKVPEDNLKPSSSSEIEKILATADTSSSTNLTIITDQTNPKSNKALNAYLQELNQPLHDQTAQLITGIDLYA
jgi:hypothetical protein